MIAIDKFVVSRTQLNLMVLYPGINLSITLSMSPLSVPLLHLVHLRVDVWKPLTEDFGIFVGFDLSCFRFLPSMQNLCVASPLYFSSSVCHAPMPSDACPGYGLYGYRKAAADPIMAIFISP